jgi:hypothetical protein
VASAEVPISHRVIRSIRKKRIGEQDVISNVYLRVLTPAYPWTGHEIFADLRARLSHGLVSQIPLVSTCAETFRGDVRIYRLALSRAEVLALLPASPRPTLASRNAGASGLRIAWPVTTYGYSLQKSASLISGWSDAGLTVTVEGNERVAYASVSARAQFFRLVQ